MENMEKLANVSYLVPAWEYSRSARQEFRKVAIQDLMSRAIKDGLVKNTEQFSQLVARQLLPQDLGLCSWKVPPMQTGIFSTWVEHRLPPFASAFIYSTTIVADKPCISRIRLGFGHNMTTKAELDVTKLYSVLPIIRNLATYINQYGFITSTFGDLRDIRMEAYFAHRGLFYNHETVIRIDLHPEEKVEDYYLVLNGFVLESVGATIV